MYMKSKQWEHICQKRIANFDINNFKQDLPGYAFTNFNPVNNGMRYLKSLTYYIAMNLNNRAIAFLKNIKNREVGNPIDVITDRIKVDMDYIQAYYEYVNIEGYLVDSVIEIGAGYGRTCHAILSNSNIQKYIIVDIPDVLEISKQYLYKVLSRQQFKKIQFCDTLPIPMGDSYDLCININGFSEMTIEDVGEYVEYANEYCQNFYVKGPSAYYADSSICVPSFPNNGMLQNNIIDDIHDYNKISKCKKTFVECYKPKDMYPLYVDWAIPWSYFLDVIYERSKV